jgi:hypothetical protein
MELAQTLLQLDLVLLDIQLHFEGGYTILNRIGATPKFEQTQERTIS